MKCPKCGLENPASATVCQCGYSLGTGKASLRESLAEQAQGFRKEVKKIQTVDPGVPREEISTIKVDADVKVEVGKGHKSKGVGQRLLIASAVLFVPMVVVFNVLSSLTGMSEEELAVLIIWPGGFLVTILVFAVFCGKREGFIVALVSIVLVVVASALLAILLTWLSNRGLPYSNLERAMEGFLGMFALSSFLCFWGAATLASRYVANCKNRRTLLWTTLTVCCGWMPLFVLMFLPAKEGLSLEESKRKLEQTSPPGFAEFLSTFFSKYSEFLKTYVVMRKPPFLLVTIWLLGMTYVIDQLEVRFLRTGEIDNWIEAWTTTVVVGLLIGCLFYWILGTWYHLRVWLSGGSGEMYLSRNLFVYSGIPLYLVTISWQITDTLVYRNDYFINPTFLFLDLTWFVLAVTAIVYSISLSYKGVRLLHSSATFRSIMFFIVLPGIFYALIAYTAFDRLGEGVSYNDQAVEEMTAGNYDEAERLFKLALRQMTKDDQEDMRTIHESLGLLFLNKGDNDQALKHYQEAVSRSDLNGPAYYSNSGEVKLLEGNVTEAIEDFERVLELEPDHLSVNNNLGLIFLGTIDEDIVDFERALPHNQKAYALIGDLATMGNLAQNFYALDRYSDALPLFETLNSFSPDNALAKYYIGLIYWENGDPTRARIFLNEAIQLDPSLYSEEIGEILGIPPGEQRTGSEI